MKAPDPFSEPQPEQTEANPQEFSNFMGNSDFLREVNDNGEGSNPKGMVPAWVNPQLLMQLLEKYGPSKAIIPHPNIDLQDISK